MYKFIKAIFAATLVMLAFGTPTLAKKEDVHNKAPGPEKVVNAPHTLAIASVMEELYVYSAGELHPRMEYALLRLTEEDYNTIEKSWGSLKPPDERWCKSYSHLSDKKKKQPEKWKDIHRRSEL